MACFKTIFEFSHKLAKWCQVKPMIFGPLWFWSPEVFPRAGDDLTIPEKLRGHVQVPRQRFLSLVLQFMVENGPDDHGWLSRLSSVYPSPIVWNTKYGSQGMPRGYLLLWGLGHLDQLMIKPWYCTWYRLREHIWCILMHRFLVATHIHPSPLVIAKQQLQVAPYKDLVDGLSSSSYWHGLN